MRRWAGASLRLRLALLMAALAALLSFALGAATYVEVQGFMVASLQQRLLATAPLVTGVLRPGELDALDAADSAARLGSRIRQSNALSGADIMVQVLGSGGQPGPFVGPGSSTAAPAAPGTLPAPGAATLRRAAAAPYCAGVVLGAPAPGRALMCVVAIRDPEHPAAGVPSGYLVLAAPLAGVDATLAHLRLVLALGMAALVVLALTLSPAVARLGLRPLTAMAAAAERMGTGDLGRRLPEPQADGEVRNLAVSFNGLLDRIEAAFAAQGRSEAQARQFAADASHELRSPLTVLAGSADVLLLGMARDPAGAERIVRRMQREIQRLKRLVQDLLLLARLDAAGDSGLHMEPVWVKDVVQRAIRQMRPVAGARTLAATAGPDVADAWVRGDDDQLYRLLINLLDNAIRHTAEDGRIEVALQVREGHVAVSVADDGGGIPPEHLPHIFDRFYRADPSRTRETGNAGLGLAIAKRSAEAHGGDLTVESAVGQGARFTLSLPLLEVPGAAPPDPAPGS